jgi:hypothetical protein
VNTKPRPFGVTVADEARAKKLRAQTLSGSSARPRNHSGADSREADRHVAEMREALHGWQWGR